jgi:hypothetical protein
MTEIETLRARVAELEAALREALNAMNNARYTGSPYTNEYEDAIATINKVLNDDPAGT